MKRRLARVFWRVVNPPVMLFAGRAPWWLVLETKGRRSGLPRRLPLARGPVEGDTFWLISAHGRRALWVRNLEADSRVRIRHRGRWLDGEASVEPLDDTRRARFNLYARSAAGALAIEPCLVRVDTRRTISP